MGMAPRLDLRQSQSLVMTPQLRQAIQLLQFSNIEAAAFIEDEVLRNPLLEHDDGGSVAVAVAPEPEASDAGMVAAETVPAAAAEPLDVDYSNSYDVGGAADGGGPVGSGGRESGEDGAEIDHIADREINLREHLEQQARLAFADGVEFAIAGALIAALEPSGRLAEPPRLIADALGVELTLLEAVRQRMMRFDPTGVFACDLRECLAVQLAEKNRLDPAMAILLDHLDLLARREMRALLERCAVDAEDLSDMIAEIKRLDPKPGARFDAEPLRALVPDVLMRMLPDGEFMLELNPETMPRLLIRRGFHAKLAVNAPRETKSFLAERLQSANWLIKALESRAQTILRVAAEIVRRQDGFFRFGIAYLRPLTLRDIAEALEIHESTVSRVTSNKAMATPRGVFEMKFFFTTALVSANGDSHSAEAVRHRIGRLIEGEGAAAILSDDAVAQILQKEGIDIARRTVAKYREAMRIPGSAQRKREKSLVG